MTWTAIALVLFSALLHAGWNLLGKRQSPSLAFFLLAMLAAGIAGLPLLLLQTDWLRLPAIFWWLLLGSGLFQALYMAGLAWAYARGHVSMLYPLARALPVLLVPLFSLLWLGGVAVSPLALAGMLVVFLSTLLMPLHYLRQWHWSVYLTPALGFIVLAALGTTGYTLVDKAAIDVMGAEGYGALQAGLHYMLLQAWAAALWMLPMALVLPAERRALRVLGHGRWWPFVSAGLMIVGTYGLVLIAMSFTREVSYLMALRQASIPIGMLAGIWLLREPLYRVRLLGLGLMLTGLGMVMLF